jgi:putative membrane protein
MSFFKDLFNLHQGEEKKEKVIEDIISNISFRGSNLWILACAILIASIGLNVNSTAVIIGAMLISPLMGPIVGAGFALATYDFDLLKKTGRSLFIATVVSLIVSFVYFYISPFKDAQSELLARTSPTIYDVLIAFVGGVVGAISLTRQEKGNPIPGVAIATALMPPLCTAGFGLATGNLSFFLGAFYLYSINCFFIGIATFLIIKYLKYKPKNTGNEVLNKRLHYVITSLVMLIITPSLYLAYTLLEEKKFYQNVDHYITAEFENSGYTIIYKKINYKTSPKTLELAFLDKKFTEDELKTLQTNLQNFNILNTELIIRQKESDISKEILSEINKNKSSLSNKDVKIKHLTEELESYKPSDPTFAKEVKALFPNIEDFYFGKLNKLSLKDSLQTATIMIYTPKKEMIKSKEITKEVDTARLQHWLAEKFKDKDVKLILNN